jgi:hypothetical protein
MNIKNNYMMKNNLTLKIGPIFHNNKSLKNSLKLKKTTDRNRNMCFNVEKSEHVRDSNIFFSLGRG